MSSGVLVNPECQSAFQQITESKSGLRYIIYKIDDKEVVVESTKLSDEVSLSVFIFNYFFVNFQLGIDKDDYEDNSKQAWEAFIKDLKERTDGFNDCRYAVFDFKFSCNRAGAGASKMDKAVFIQLCPDNAPIKKRMVYASSASAIKSALGTEKFLQFHVADEVEIAHEELLKKINEKFRDN